MASDDVARPLRADARRNREKLLAVAELDFERAQMLFTRSLIAIQSIDGRLPTTTTTTDNSPGNIFG